MQTFRIEDQSAGLARLQRFVAGIPGSSWLLTRDEFVALRDLLNREFPQERANLTRVDSDEDW